MPPGKQVFKFRNGLHKDWDTDGWEDGEKLKKEKCGTKQWGDREVIVNINGNQTVGPYCLVLVKIVLRSIIINYKTPRSWGFLFIFFI